MNIINYDNINTNLLIFSKAINTSNNYKKISIGYNTENNLYILSPLLINSVIQMDKYLKLKFDPMLGSILTFYNQIKLIETKINQRITKYNKNYILCSILKDDIIDEFDNDLNTDLFAKYIKLDINTHTKIYNNLNQESTINELQINYNYKIILKLDYIWIDLQSRKFGLKISLVQLKIIPPLYMTRCLIDNHISNYSPEINQQPITNISNILIQQSATAYTTKTTKTITAIPTNIQTTPISVVNPISTSISNQIQPSVPIVDKIIFRPPDPLQLLQLKNSLKKVIE